MADMRSTPFLKIKDACAVTGLSQYFLRTGCKDGSIPHVKSGQTYYVNIPALLAQLNAEPCSGAGALPGGN